MYVPYIYCTLKRHGFSSVHGLEVFIFFSDLSFLAMKMKICDDCWNIDYCTGLRVEKIEDVRAGLRKAVILVFLVIIIIVIIV